PLPRPILGRVRCVRAGYAAVRVRPPHVFRRSGFGPWQRAIVSLPETGDGRMWWFILIVSLASIPLSAVMAEERERSPRAWAWVAALVGPFAPLLLLLLGRAKRTAPAN